MNEWRRWFPWLKLLWIFDDTLYSFRDISKDALFYLAQERNDKQILNAAYTEALQWRTLADVAGLEVLQEAIRLAHSPEVMKNLPPYPGAPDTIKALYDEGHELIYISNRDPESVKATHKWLWDNEFPIESPSAFSGTTVTRAELKCLWGDKLPHIRDCRYMIDDRASTLINFTRDPTWYRMHREEKRKGFGIHAPHNTNLTDIEDIYLAPTWAGLNFYLVGKGLLSQPAYEPFGHLKEKAHG
jgi:hypothetical protein